MINGDWVQQCFISPDNISRLERLAWIFEQKWGEHFTTPVLPSCHGEKENKEFNYKPTYEHIVGSRPIYEMA